MEGEKCCVVRAQWNFLNFSEQKVWHWALGVSPVCEEMHWFAPCCAAAVITLPPAAKTARPLLARLSCVRAPPRPLETWTREEFQVRSSATPSSTSNLRTTRSRQPR